MECAQEGDWSRGLIRALGDFFLPISCVICDRLFSQSDEGVICGRCWTLVSELPNPRCSRCGHPCAQHACQWCDNLPAFVRSARSYCWIGAGTGKEIVHALKYEGWTRAAAKMGERMSRVRFPSDVEEEHPALIPVPLSNTRKRERGFNQSELLAISLAKWRHAEMMSDVLCRVSAIRSQTQLTPGERLSNVAGAFSVPNDARSRIRGRHLMLVDDVITTGATLRAAAEALFAAGARTISYMTFGRAPASGDRLFP